MENLFEKIIIKLEHHPLIGMSFSILGALLSSVEAMDLILKYLGILITIGIGIFTLLIKYYEFKKVIKGNNPDKPKEV